jgi:hypothetical protein
MAIHEAKNGIVVTVQQGPRDRQRNDIPRYFTPDLEQLANNNKEAIDSWIQTENYVKETEWDHFLNYLRKDGISESHIRYLNSNPNYIASNELNGEMVAGTFPKYPTLTYLIPANFEESVEQLARTYGINTGQTQTMLYLHEALHNYIHHYKKGGIVEKKEIEIESFLTNYFTHRAETANNEFERERYLQIANVTSERLENLERKLAHTGGTRQAALAALADEYDMEIDEFTDYVSNYETVEEAIEQLEEERQENNPDGRDLAETSNEEYESAEE